MLQDHGQVDAELRDDETGTVYRRLRPLPPLEGLVDGVWIQSDPRDFGASWTPTRVLPTGCPELIYDHADPFVRVEGERAEVLPALAVGGQRTRAIRVTSTGRTGLVLIGFKPWAAGRFFAGGLAEMRDEIVDLGRIEGRGSATRLRDALRRSADLETAADALQRALVTRLRPPASTPLAERAVREIWRAGGSQEVERLAHKLGVGRRRLHRVFLEAVGLGPKRFADVVRFQASVACRARGLPWADVAAACGYCDQAHLIRRWREVTGSPPQALMQERAEPTALGAFFNEPPASQFSKTIYL